MSSLFSCLVLPSSVAPSLPQNLLRGLRESAEPSSRPASANPVAEARNKEIQAKRAAQRAEKDGLLAAVCLGLGLELELRPQICNPLHSLGLRSGFRWSFVLGRQSRLYALVFWSRLSVRSPPRPPAAGC